MYSSEWDALGERARGALGRGQRHVGAAVGGGDLDRAAADLAEEGDLDAVSGERFELGAVAAEQESAGALAEERLLGRAAALAQVLEVDPAADARADRRLGQGAGEAAAADAAGGWDGGG